MNHSQQDKLRSFDAADLSYGDSIAISSISDGSKAWVISQLVKDFSQLLIVCKGKKESESILQDLQFLNQSEIPILSYPAWDLLPFEWVSPSIDIMGERLTTLSVLSEGGPAIVVAPIQAIIQHAFPPLALKELSKKYTTHEEISIEDLAEELLHAGYQPVSLVEDIGEIAVRGGVVDLFSPQYQFPLRIEFIGNQIESVKFFDPDTQRSHQNINEIQVVPVREFCDSFVLRNAKSSLQKVKDRGKEFEVPPRELARIIAAIRKGIDLPGKEQLFDFLTGAYFSLFDYLSLNAGVVLDEPEELSAASASFWDNISERESRFCENQEFIAPSDALYFRPEKLLQQIKNLQCKFELNPLHSSKVNPTIDVSQDFRGHSLEIPIRTHENREEPFSVLSNQISKWRTENYSVAIVTGSQQRAERLRKALLEHNLAANISHASGIAWSKRTASSPLAILLGHLSEGFRLPKERLVFIAENQIFAERSYRKGKNKTPPLSRLLASLSRLTENDFIVHQDYGIGIYRGLRHLEVEGSGHDFLHLEYAGGSRLYLPVENISKVQKYVSQEGREPKLDKLGSTRWSRTKAKVRASVVSLAGELIRLYATRETVRGWRFEPYGSEDEKFADLFPFDETPDQLAAIEATLEDMASDRPMDRLICGDAGFGKTEVA
ncbi:MAG: hypothetical protein KDD53_07970, partial [Bdellovibrionales bacterium]|nr:hypothetical protein [Bdellovibrionales bacterium]